MALISRSEAARALGVSPEAVYAAVKSGRLSVKKDSSGKPVVDSETMREEWAKNTQTRIGIGPKAADSIVAFFSQETNRSIIEKLNKAGVNLGAELVISEEGPLSRQDFVITGRLETFTRTEAEAKIRELGGAIGSTVTKKTAYLVLGADPGSKLDRARALGTTVLSEQSFLELIEKITEAK